MKKGILILVFFTIFDCQQQPKSKKSKQEESLPEMSIYHLPGKWTTHNFQDISLVDLKGKVLVVVMIYTTCKAACPRLIADMQNILTQIEPKTQKNLQMILVSIDPATDTPEHLNAFAKENGMDQNPWLFLRGTEADTRTFAAVLAVKYKKITPMDFSHSNIISVFNPQGELVHQREGLGVDNEETIEEIKKQLKQID